MSDPERLVIVAAALSEFGVGGSGNGQFNHPWGVAVDKGGNVWVSDYYQNRVEKFDSSGAFLSKFGVGGSNNGQFANPTGIAIDGSGNRTEFPTGRRQ